MAALSVLFRLLADGFHLAVSLGPAFTVSLRAALDRHRIVGHVFRDHRARADIGAVADLYRRHQRGIGADEGAGADRGLVFGKAIIIASDGAGADVALGADMGVADIGEMIDLDARFERRGL